MKRKLIGLHTIHLVSLLLLPDIVLAQGSLAPPGPPAPTMKTLDEIEPRIDLAGVSGSAGYHHHITSPGSYFMSGNLDVTLLAGIRIQAEGVTLDMNGFEIRRTAATAGHAIQVDAISHRCTIKNGSISGGGIGFTQGVLCTGSGFPLAYARAGSLRNIDVTGCINTGLFAGEAWRIEDCTAHDNVGDGIVAQEGSTLTRCTANANQRTYGIFAGDGSTLNQCTAFDNQSEYAIRAGDGSVLNHCTARNNMQSESAGYGIHAGAGSTLTGCAVTGNNHSGSGYGHGIITGPNCALVDCSAVNNDSAGIYGYGIKAGEASTLNNCNASGNTHIGSNTGHGIFAGDGSALMNCTAFGNRSINTTGYGILAGSGSSLDNCVANDNEAAGTVSAGISAPSATMKNCTANKNDGDGIQVEGAAVLAYCAANENAGSGIDVGNGSVLSHCAATANTGAYGIRSGTGCSLSHCTAQANSSSASDSAGIYANAGSTVFGCTASETDNTNQNSTFGAGSGISVHFGSKVESCTVYDNGENGILIHTDTFVQGCTARDNENAGIMASSLTQENRIEGNHLNNNRFGIVETGDPNFIARNTAYLNQTNFFFSSGGYTPTNFLGGAWENYGL